MNRPAALLTVCACAALALTAARDAGTSSALGCHSAEGDVIGYTPTAAGSCPGLLAVGQTIYRKETIHADPTGGVTFETKHIYRCIQTADAHGTADRLYPRKGIALAHLRGTTWCLHRPGDRGKTLTVPGATITLQGTLIGMHTDPHGSAIKLIAGKARVTSTASHQSITLRPLTQTAVAANQPLALRRAPIKLTAQERQAAFDLKSDIVLMSDPTQPGSYLKLKQQHSAVVVAQDAATAQTETAALKAVGVRSLAATFAQVTKNPNRVLAYLNRIKAITVILIGNAPGLQPVAKALTPKLPPTVTLLSVTTG